jgi:hypothetical protein
LEILRGNLFDTRISVPKIDDYVFNAAANIVSRGARVEKILNNRADALNFAVAHALNAGVLHRNSRFIIVSNSRAMQRLNRFAPIFDPNMGLIESKLEENIDSGHDSVWSARRASIYQMLLMSANDESHAARTAWTLIEAVAQLRVYLLELRDEKRLPLFGELKIDNVFLELIASFGFIQSQLESLSGGHARNIKLLDRSFRVGYPKDLYLSLSETVHKRLEEEGYIDRIDPRRSKASSPMIVHEFGKVVDFCFDDFRELATGDNDLVAAAALSDNSLTVWTESAASLSEYVNAINLIRDSVIQNFTSGLYKFGFSDTKREIGHLLRSHIILITVNDRFEISWDENQRYELADICSEAGVELADVRFLRIDTAVFSSSYEGKRKVIRVSHNLREELAIFLGRLVPTEFMSSDLRGKVDELIASEKLAEPEFS